MGEVGNTKQPLQLKNWFFTLNNYTNDDIRDLETCFNSLSGCKYVFQEELGANGTPHLQGQINLTKKMRWSEFKLTNRIHFEKTRNVRDAIEYCRKLDTRNGKIFSNIKIPKPIQRINKESLYDWQKEIVAIINEEPDPRKIYWYIDKEGGKGKSELCRYLCLEHDAILLAGKSGDMKYGIMKYNEKRGYYPEVILIDLPRTFDNNYLCYTGIEEIKNGMFFNTKYESDMVIFNRPHIIIFSNTKPDKDNLSLDRWVIKEL